MPDRRSRLACRHARGCVLAAIALAWAVTVAGQSTTRSALPPGAVAPPAVEAAPRPVKVTDAKRLALVVGNSKYQSAGTLRNPANDAKAVATVLREQGFEVVYLEDVGVGNFRKAIREFTQRAQVEEGVALFYYAGHAVSIGGHNYLLPTDIRPNDPEEVRDDSIDVDNAILGRLDKSAKQFKILILDSCRNNPFLTPSTRGTRAGLSDIAGSGGTLVAFSTAPGRVAEDGKGDNSTFTLHLVNELRKGGEIEQVFKRVRIAVHGDTGGKQEPWVNASLHSNLYLLPEVESPPPMVASLGSGDEQQRILANIEISERKRDAERQRMYEERTRDKLQLESKLKALEEGQRRDREERLMLVDRQRRLYEETSARMATFTQVVAELREIGSRRTLSDAEAKRLEVTVGESQVLSQKAATDGATLQAQIDVVAAREAERRQELAALVSQAERINEPIAPQRPRVAADGTMFVRGVSLPKGVAIDGAATPPASCAAFQGAWAGRWDGLRTVELWVQRFDGTCAADIVYGRGGQSIDGETPRFVRAKGVVSGSELRVSLPDDAVIRAKPRGERTLDATWTKDGRTVSAELRRIADDPAVPATSFAQEDRDFGARPTRYIEVPNPSKPLPLTVPGVATVTTLELKDMIAKDRELVLVDAYSDANHMTIPGAWWRPDLGTVRPGAFPLAEMAKVMQEVTQRNYERPIVVFERSASWGWYGYNAALRLVGMGYTNVYWYRGGIDAWFDAGFQMTKVEARRVAGK